MANKKGNSALAKIVARAKQLQKKKPSAKWANLIKEAGKDYRAGKLGATLMLEKGETRRTKPKRVYQQVRTKSGAFKGTKTVGATAMPPVVSGVGGSSIAGMKAALRNDAKNKLAGALLRRDMATTKRDKKKIGKAIAGYRKEVKKFC